MYASLGLRVLPIKPKSKRPPMTKWVEAATTDPAIITNWFTHLYADHGVGLAMGLQPDGRFIFALDVDEHDPSRSGSETLADLEAEHGALPDTVRSITGSGGLHLLFVAPVEVRNGSAGESLDIRGEGGQIVVAPTLHPATGRAYAWEAGFAPWERDIAETPEWLLNIIVSSYVPLTPSAPPSTQSSAGPIFNTPDSPAEWLRSRWDWPLQLRDAGWVEHHTARNGDVHWTRPGKNPREGESAILHLPDGPFVVFSTDASMTGLHHAGHVNRDGSVSVSPFDFYVAHRHGGDASAAGRTLRAMMDPPPAPTARRLSTPPPAVPTVARRVRSTAASSIGVRRVHWLWDGRIAIGTLSLLAGPEGLGKSTFAYWLAAQVTMGLLPGENDGVVHGVLVCATEDSWEHTVVPRLMAHGADLDRVYRLEVEVDGAPYAELSLPADLLDVEEAATETDASLMILDPLMSRLDAKLDTHRDGEVRQALEPLVRTAGRARLACLGLIHHNKSGSTDPLDLVMASKAFTAVARSVHTVLRDPDDDTGHTRLFGTTKNNLGRLDLPVRTFTIGTYTYDTFADDGSFDGTGEVGQLQWGADSMTSIGAALRSAGDAGGGNAVDWLRDYMQKHGPRVNSRDVYRAADDIPPRSLRRAKEKLGLDSEDVGAIGRGRQTYWFDPDDRRLADDDDPNPPPNLGDIT